MGDSELSQNSDVENTLEVSDSYSSIDDQHIGNDEKDKQASDDKLPDTGEVKENSGLMSGMFAAMGGIFLFRSRRKNKRDNESS
nr:LPXTG cell wall anchor domain-containing protein [Mammaliicoccus sp. G-M28]